MRELKLLRYKQLEKDISLIKPLITTTARSLKKKKEKKKLDLHFKERAGIEMSIINETSIPVLKFIQEHLGDYSASKVIIPSSYKLLEKKSLIPLKTLIRNNNARVIIDFIKTNNKRYINKFFEAVNSLLPDAGIYIGCVETNQQRNKRLYGDAFNKRDRIKIFFEFVFHRVLPKLNSFKKLYFAITKGKYRFLSTAETLGRIVSCGFEIIEFKVIRNQTYFVAMKTRKPYYDKTPSFGPLVKMKRIGQNGEIIKVYKFRTMHPYSEYIQDFVLKLNGYNTVGKPANDFRLTPWGQLFRKYWLDELPQLINVFKGEMRIVGVRPLSRTRFNEFPEDMQKERIKYKPGCIPPYVALNMPSDNGNIKAERIYLEDKKQQPFLTDLRYILKALFNIFSHKITSS